MRRRQCPQLYIQKTDIVLAILISVVTLLWTDNGYSAVRGVLGGIIYSEDGQIDSVGLGKWLFIYGVCFLMTGRKIAEKMQIYKYTVYRSGSFAGWWRKLFTEIQLYTLVILFLYSSLWLVVDVIQGTWYRDGMIMVTFYLHCSLYITVFLVSSLFMERNAVPCLLLLLEGMLYCISVKWKLPMLNSGMYVELITAGKIRYYLILMFQMAGIVGLYLLVPKLQKKGCLERRKI